MPSSQSDLKVGDKIVLEATEDNPFGAAGTVTAATKNSDGTVSVTFKQATDPSEVFFSLEATQWDVAIDSSMAEVEGAASGAGGVSAEDSWSPSGGAIGDGFNIKLDNNGSYVKGNFSVKPTIGYDVKWTLFGGLERCELVSRVTRASTLRRTSRTRTPARTSRSSRPRCPSPTASPSTSRCTCT